MAFYNAKIKKWASSQRPIVLSRGDYDEQVGLIWQSFASLTGEPCSAVILNQLLYWALRITDFELFVAEEKRAALQDHPSFYHGWFSRSAQEILKATLLTISVSTIRRYLNFLAERGWVQIRKRSQNKWTRTPQYRVNLRKLCIDLQEHGYSLPDFSIYEVLFPSKQENSEESKRPDINFNINPNTNINFAVKGENRFLKGRNL